jgi:transcriptional regulator with XRE-family HTH domain
MKQFELLKDRLADAIKEAGLSASELARACNVTAAAVSKWLDGRTKKLSADNYASAARALGVREEWLRTGKLPRERQNAPEEREIDHVLTIIDELREPIAALAAAMARLAAISLRSKKSKLS